MYVCMFFYVCDFVGFFKGQVDHGTSTGATTAAAAAPTLFLFDMEEEVVYKFDLLEMRLGSLHYVLPTTRYPAVGWAL